MNLIKKRDCHSDKVAILTQTPIGLNYGGTIQNYALQTILRNAGFDPITVNRIRRPEHSMIKRSLSVAKLNFLNIIGNKLRISPKIFNKIYHHQFKFVDKHIKITKKIESTKQLKRHFKNSNYAAVIVGSDQTWRPKFSPCIENYFLDFLTNDSLIKKIAYASSFGVSEWEFNNYQTEKFAELVKQFDRISVRESSGVDLCKNYLMRDAKLVLDPTMLLSKEDYINLINQVNTHKRTGIFSYLLDQDVQCKRIAEYISQLTGLRLFKNQPKNHLIKMQSNSLEDYIVPPIEGWISSFNESEFVVTNSFHGTVFAIIFNKKFISIVNEARGKSRFESLLGELGLTNRLVLKNVDVATLKTIVDSEIDYSAINLKLRKMKQDSIEFLNTSLQKV